MKSRKEFFKNIAQRYQLGYAEINNTTEIYLTSAYLQIYPETLPPSMPSPPFYNNSTPEIDELLNFTEGDSHHSFVHLYTQDIPASISIESINKMHVLMDSKFPQHIVKNANKQTSSAEPFIFDGCQIGINKALTSPILQQSFKFSAGYFSDSSRYSVILNFNSSLHLKKFLDGISEEDKLAAMKKIYATYECTYGSGCYQILIPYGREYPAILLLLGRNLYTANLPITEYLLNRLKPTSFLMPRYSSLTDLQYKIVFEIIQKFINKQEKTLLSDFDPITQSIINSNKGILKAFNDTTEYFNKIESLLGRHVPKELNHLIRQYNVF